MSLYEKPVQVEDQSSTGNVLPLLHEVRHALNQLLVDNQASSIDLLSLPLSAKDEESLKSVMAKGEVEAQLHSLGESFIWETRWAGVWWIEHYNTDQHLMSRYLEITWYPELLRSSPEDVEVSLEQLQQYLKMMS